jgi:hypothetical protein
MTRVRDQMELTLPVGDERALLLVLGYRRVCEARETCRIEMTVWKDCAAFRRAWPYWWPVLKLWHWRR